AVFPDDLEVRILDRREDARLASVVELVSPGNLDRPETRRAFAAKSSAYLQRGIGLIVVDVVTTYRFNLHNALLELLGSGASNLMPAEEILYAAAYRPVRRQETNQIDVWHVPLQLGGALPLLPLALRGAGPVPLDLDATYAEVRQRTRL